jgi:hypothetical protein
VVLPELVMLLAQEDDDPVVAEVGDANRFPFFVEESFSYRFVTVIRKLP